jgi:tetratricopeptide (TPR) repeat protein
MRWVPASIAAAACSALAHAAPDHRAVCTTIDETPAQARLIACNAAMADSGKNDAGAAELQAHRGLAYSDMENHSKAVLDLDVAIALDPKAIYFYWRGLARQRATNIKLAMADYNQAIKQDPAMPAALINRSILKGNTGDFVGGIADTSVVLKTRPGHVMALFNRAMLQTMRGKFIQAEQDLEKIQQVAPGFPGVALVRGYVHMQRHEYELAIAAFTPMIDKEKGKLLVAPLLGRASAYLGLKRFDKARADIAAAEKSWGHPGTCGDCIAVKADLGVRQGRFAIAEIYAAKALALLPDSRHMRVLQCYVKAGGPTPAGAISLCTEVVKEYPQSIFPAMNRAMAHLKLGDLDAALKDYDAILKLGDWTGSGHFGRGIIFKRRGDSAKAKAEFALAKKVSPNVEERFAIAGIRP